MPRALPPQRLSFLVCVWFVVVLMTLILHVNEGCESWYVPAEIMLVNVPKRRAGKALPRFVKAIEASAR